MKVKIEYTIDVGDNIRRGINIHYGIDGLATREEVKGWYRQHGEGSDDDLTWSVQMEAEEEDGS